MNIFDLIKEELVGVVLSNNDVEIKEYDARIELSKKGVEIFTVYDNEKMFPYKKYKYRFTSFYYFSKSKTDDRSDVEWAFDTDEEEAIITKIRELINDSGCLD